METIVYINAYAAIGIFVVWSVLSVLALFAWHFGKLVWRRVTRVYHITVIAYWLERLEKGGWREFQKAEAEDKKRAAQGASDGRNFHNHSNRQST